MENKTTPTEIILFSNLSLEEENHQFSHENFYLFETLKIETHQLNDLDLHLDRLFRSLNTLNKNILLKKDEVKSLLSELILPSTGRLRLNYSKHNIWLQITELAKYPDVIKLGFDDEASVYARNYLLQHKTSLYSLNKYLQAKRLDLDDVIFVNQEGIVTETTKANIFIFDHQNEQLITSPVTSGLLPGIERQKLLNQKKYLCQNKEYLILEKEIRKIDIQSNTDFLLTNSLMGAKFGKMV